MLLKVFTPQGKGIFVREPPLFPTAVNDRGVRSHKGNKTAFIARKKTKRKEGTKYSLQVPV